MRQQADNELAAARATIAAQAKESGDQIAADKAEAEQNCRIMVEQAQAQATRILDEANQLGIGPMGFGGNTTVLATKITSLNRLPASFYVSVSYMCWAYRRRRMTLRDGQASYQ